MEVRNNKIAFCTSIVLNRGHARQENADNGDISQDEKNNSESQQRQDEMEEERSRVTPDERPITETFWLFFSVAHFAGLILPARDKTGSYVLSWKRAIPYILSALSCVLSFAYVIWIASEDCSSIRYVINSQSFLAYLFCLRVYTQTAENASLMVQEMENAKLLRMNIRWASTPYFVIAIAFLPLLVSTCLTLAYPELEVLPNLLPSVVSLLLPIILDVLIGIFASAIRMSYARLRFALSLARGRNMSKIHCLYQQWVKLSEILRTHNKLFGSALHLRIWLFVVSIMVNAYVLISLRSYRGKCQVLVTFTALPLAETVLYFFVISSLGEMLIREDIHLLQVLLRETYQEAAGSPEQLALSNFCSRVCARKAELRDEGSDSDVSARTFVTKLSLATTTLAVLLQLNPEGMAESPDSSSSFDTYDICFTHNGTSGFDFF